MMLWEHFDKNEIYILSALVALYAAFFLFPKILPKHITVFFLVWGFTSSTFFDFTIGGGLLDFYTVNDSDKYELTDLLTYFLFAPFSYFFIYFYEKLNINKKRFIWYVLAWCIAGLVMEKISDWMGVTHYKGYKLSYSLVVFLIVQTTTGLYYELIKSSWKKDNKKTGQT